MSVDRLRQRRSVGAACLLTLCLAVTPLCATAAAWDVEALMRQLAQKPSGQARFTEKKYIAMLDRPVESSGELRYQAPDRFEKHTLKPRAESMVLAQGTLTLERSGRQQQMRLQEYPEIAALVESIRGTLTGDRDALERLYQLRLDGTEARWALVLVPRQARMRGVIQRVRIEGGQGEVRSVEIEQSDNDRSVMTIDKVAAP